MNGKNIIFLISQPRSGSTLIQRILSNHSAIATTSESWLALPFFWNDPIENFKINKKVPFNSRWTETAIKASLRTNETYQIDLKPQLATLYENICNEHCLKQHKKYFLDKTPRYYYIVKDIIKYFPESKIIILIRNPLAVLSSILNTWVKNDWPLLSNFKDDLLVAPRNLQTILTVNHSNTLLVKYEDILEQPDIKITEILNFIGLEYEPKIEMLEATKKAWVFGDPKNAFKTEKVEKASNDWKNIKSKRQWRMYKEYFEYLESINFFEINTDYKKEIEAAFQSQNTGAINKSSFFSLNFYMTGFANKYLIKIIKIKRRIKNKIIKSVC